MLREDPIDYFEQQLFQEQSTHEEQIQAEPIPSLQTIEEVVLENL